MWINILLVGLGSMAGGIARFLLSGWIRQTMPGLFPWGTLAVNLAGCFLMGVLAGAIPASSWLTDNHRMLLAIGFCGSFTTFSAFALENLELLSGKAFGLFLLYLFFSVGGGLAAAWGGFLLGRK